MASVIIQKEDNNSALIVFTQGEYIFRELIVSQLRDYKGKLGKVLYFSGTEPQDSTIELDTYIKVSMKWSKEYESNEKNFNLLLIELLSNIRKTYMELKSRFLKQQGFFN